MITTLDKPMKTVSAAEANRQFSKLLRAVQEGETVTITSRGKPVARLLAADDDQAREARRLAHERLLEHLRNKPAPAIRLEGKFNRDWAYDD